MQKWFNPDRAWFRPEGTITDYGCLPLHHYYRFNFKVFDKEVTVNERTCIKYRNYTKSITTVIMQSNKCSYSLCPEQTRQKIVKVHIKINFINCFIKLCRSVVFNTKKKLTRAMKKLNILHPYLCYQNNSQDCSFSINVC